MYTSHNKTDNSQLVLPMSETGDRSSFISVCSRPLYQTIYKYFHVPSKNKHFRSLPFVKVYIGSITGTSGSVNSKFGQPD